LQLYSNINASEFETFWIRLVEEKNRLIKDDWNEDRLDKDERTLKNRQF